MSTREKILAAAEEVFAKKGFVNSSISEIAKTAGVADSLIYQYFKGKIDLLYSVTADRIKEILPLLEEQLQGIRDAESLLSKMIWFHLHYNHTHKGYIRLLLFECRSNPEFYGTKAYKLARKYAGIMFGILRKGVEDGRFTENFDMRIVREILLGGLDFEDLGYLVIGETQAAYQDFDGIMDLVLSMIDKSSDPKPYHRENKKRYKIMEAGEKIFAQKGFRTAKIAEIAKLVGVAEGTVFEYFKNKEDLLLSIPKIRFDDIRNSLEEAFEIKGPKRKIRRLIRHHFSLFLNRRDFLKVFLRNILVNPAFYESDAYGDFRLYIDTIEDVIKEGIKEGIFRAEVNPRIFRNFFLGAFYHMGLRWFMLENEEQSDKMAEIDNVTDLLCRSILKA